MIARAGNKKPRPARRGLTGADEVDFEGSWKVLSSSLREIHTKNASKLSFEELYRNAYKIVLKKKGEVLYERVRSFEQEWLSAQVRERIRSLVTPSLLSDTEESGAGTSPHEKRAAGEKFLRGLKQAWEDHQVCMNMTTDVLMYMDRVYCADQHKPSIFVAAMALFRDCVLRSPLPDVGQVTIMSILNLIILEHIHMERQGDMIDRNLIKSCIYMLEGLYESTNENDDERLYLTSFEADFLAASREFYRSEGNRLLRESNAGSYCRHTRKRINEEEDRCRSTLSQATTPAISHVVEDELIKNKMRELIEMESGVKYMVDNDRLDELELVFDLNSRVDPRKLELTRAIQKRVVEMGSDINTAAIAASQAQSASTAEVDGEGPKDTKQTMDRVVNQQTVAAIKWVEDVLRLKDKYDTICKTAFQSDQVLETALTRSFSDFINAFPRSSEYISLFIDENMKKGIKGKTENEVDLLLDKAILLLRYIQDKDMFERYYKKHLCKRLLMAKSLSIDVEKQMISRMKIELGNNFTTKLEAMFTDMSRSEELTAGFKQHVVRLGDADPKRIDLSINVLTSMTWPLETIGPSSDGQETKEMKCIFPPILERIKQSFEKFYADKHNGRVLTWQAKMGTADMRVTFPKIPGKEAPLNKERRYEFNVSTYAMIVLLLFNDLPHGQSLSFDEIQGRTNIPKNELTRNLQSLALVQKHKILIKEPKSKDINPSDQFFFNESFQSKFLRVKVGVVMSGNKVEADQERKETEKKNNDSRSFNIEAAVVRIMKQRKLLSHQQLITETLIQLAAQFKPDVNMIKKRIESLIEREYLERVEESEAPAPAYRYLA